MIVKEKQIFNLWDTNGRRSDVLSALSIYIGILKELENNFPGEKWASYPESMLQYYFYEKAISYSPEVFKKHEKYDQFVEMLKSNSEVFINKNKEWIEKEKDSRFFKVLDRDIEARARHYTSNLVRIGLSTNTRRITPCGNLFYNDKISRDDFEKILPINNTNLILLRQLLQQDILVLFVEVREEMEAIVVLHVEVLVE